MIQPELYTPPEKIKYILQGHGSGNSILAERETPDGMLGRVTNVLMGVEERFGTAPEKIDQLRETFRHYFIARDFTPGMPTLTNAGREGYDQSALSSCVVIPVDLRKETAKETILAYYKQNMGSGFNFTKYEDPVAMLNWLNDLSASETATSQYDRRIANMGTLHVAHPRIREFINAKRGDKRLVHFNISIEVNDEFMEAVANHGQFRTANGEMIDAHELMRDIAQAAWECGDPGIINMDRMNSQNPIASLAPYDCSPPCGEMGLAPGETCQFGYINLAHFVDKSGQIRADELSDLVKFSVRMLDNAIEYGVENQPSPEGVQMAKLKRKIGISVAGLADALMKAGYSYDSAAGREMARDILSLINYQAKVASVELAEERGSCNAMQYTLNNLYFAGYTEDRYARQQTNTVSAEQWKELDQRIKNSGLLRNIHHTALPPGGRASMILGVNHSIEPIFSPSNLNTETVDQVLELIASSLTVVGDADVQSLFNSAIEMGTFQQLPITESARALLRTAIEIAPKDHVLMVAALSGIDGVYDESASKTVNLPETATPDDIFDIYMLGHQVGLKNISVYRDGSLNNQPRKLS